MTVDAQATVDRLRHGLYEVTVEGDGRTRKYVIAEMGEDAAAHEGLRQFADEMENMAGYSEFG